MESGQQCTNNEEATVVHEHMESDDGSGIQVHDRGKIDPCAVECDVGEVCNPNVMFILGMIGKEEVGIDVTFLLWFQPFLACSAIGFQSEEVHHPQLLQKVSMPQDWADYLLSRLENDKTESIQSVSAFVLKNQNRIKDITVKLQRLLDGYLD